MAISQVFPFQNRSMLKFNYHPTKITSFTFQLHKARTNGLNTLFTSCDKDYFLYQIMAAWSHNILSCHTATLSIMLSTFHSSIILLSLSLPSSKGSCGFNLSSSVSRDPLVVWILSYFPIESHFPCQQHFSQCRTHI